VLEESVSIHAAEGLHPRHVRAQMSDLPARRTLRRQCQCEPADHEVLAQSDGQVIPESLASY
jgi:hypothetical protein